LESDHDQQEPYGSGDASDGSCSCQADRQAEKIDTLKPMAAMGKSTGWMATMEKNPQRRLMAYCVEKVGFSAAVLGW
jgi:hypothetical protein